MFSRWCNHNSHDKGVSNNALIFQIHLMPVCQNVFGLVSQLYQRFAALYSSFQRSEFVLQTDLFLLIIQIILFKRLE